MQFFHAPDLARFNHTEPHQAMDTCVSTAAQRCGHRADCYLVGLQPYGSCLFPAAASHEKFSTGKPAGGLYSEGAIGNAI